VGRPPGGGWWVAYAESLEIKSANRQKYPKIDASPYHWPGKHSWLQNIVERSISFAPGYFGIDEAGFQFRTHPPPSPQLLSHSPPNYEKDAHRWLFRKQRKICWANGAAANAEFRRSTLDLKINRLNIRKNTLSGRPLRSTPKVRHFLRFCHSNFLFELYFSMSR